MHTYEDALKASEEYFGNSLSAKVFIDKYALRDKEDNLLESTPRDMHHRIASELARIEKSKFQNPLSYDELISYMEEFSCIIPQGSPCYGIGNKEQYVSLSNCFVVDGPEDSYGGICKTDQELVQISKRRGGIGFDLSKLRPSNTLTNNAARTTSGIGSWMERYSNSIREVGQGGRRGALMLTLSIHHPDILTFATIKNNDKNVTGANISVRLTDEFLNALKDKKDYELRWPVDSLNPQIKKKISAEEVWKTIIHSAWFRAEPGLLFWDTILKESPADCYDTHKTLSTNPCQPGWAKILTENGIRKLSEIKIGDKIWSSEGFRTIKNKWSTGIKKVYKYSTTAGVFYGTEDHKLIVNKNGKKTKAKSAETINIISGPMPSFVKFDPKIIMDGLVIGDGSVHKDSNNLVGLYIGDNDQDYFVSEISHLIKKHRPGISEKFYEIETSCSSNEVCLTFNRRVPERYIYSDINTTVSFLRGLYSANGSVCDNRITLKSASKQLIEDVQLMLSSIGIVSYFTTNKESEIEFQNGIYISKQSYDLNITFDRNKFIKLIGFIQNYKNNKIKINSLSKRKKFDYDIVSKEFFSEEEVFDITIDNNTHTYWTQGCNVSNCAELPLSAYDSCRLLVLNLFFFVKNPFTPQANFDFEFFYKMSQIAQRLMDDIVDLEGESIKRIIEKIKLDPEDESLKRTEIELWERIYKATMDGRRTGTGITALGDVLAALNISYGSDESINITEKIYKTLKLGCYRSSVDMAKELGSFPVWDYDKEKNNPFLLRIKSEDAQLYTDMKKYGRRNISLLTTAPVGSISMLSRLSSDKKLFGTTSGIEPLYLGEFTRRKKGNPGDVNFRTDFIDASGDHWMEFKVYHPGIELWSKLNIDKKKSENPYICAPNIDWKNRVKLQAAANKHVDHSISSTVNLPNTVTEEEVANIYLEAWKSGVKGITVYRDGCRTGVLINKNKIPKTDAPQRPKELECDVHHISVAKQPYFILIGLMDGEPYEVFAGKNGVVDDKIKKGTVIKHKRGSYKAIFEDESELSPIHAFTTPEEDTITRLISAGLRHGTKIEFIVHQLEKAKGDLSSFAKSITKALKKYIPDGTEIKGEECPECKAKLIRSEGCHKCISCSYSKC